MIIRMMIREAKFHTAAVAAIANDQKKMPMELMFRAVNRSSSMPIGRMQMV